MSGLVSNGIVCNRHHTYRAINKKVSYPENQCLVYVELQLFVYHEVLLYGLEG